MQSLLVVPRALAVSSPPPGELVGPGVDDVALQGVRHAPPVEHARHVDVGASALFVRANRSGHVSDAFQMPSVGVVRGFQVDAILIGCGPYGVVPPTHRLVQPVEQVVSMALLVQRYSVVDQAEVHRDIPDSRVELRLFGAVANRPPAPDVPEVREARLRDVQPLVLDAHVRHGLPNRRLRRRLDQSPGPVDVAHGEVVVERQQCRLGRRVQVLHPDEIPHRHREARAAAALRRGFVAHEQRGRMQPEERFESVGNGMRLLGKQTPRRREESKHHHAANARVPPHRRGAPPVPSLGRVRVWV